MPFTLAHPAAAVPFHKYGLPMSALVVGSMAPDFRYFTHSSMSSPFSMMDPYGHTLRGLFFYCIPAGLVMLWLFHAILKRPLLSLLPISHQARLIGVVDTFRFGPFSQFCLIIGAVLLGAVTHIIWDLFTHRTEWLVSHIPVLFQPLVQTPYGTLYCFSLLQYASTLLGVGLLAYWYFRWFKQTPTQAVPSPHLLPGYLKLFLILFMVLSSLVISILYTCRAIPLFWDARDGSMIMLSIRTGVVLTIKVLFSQGLVFSLLWHFGIWRRR